MKTASDVDLLVGQWIEQGKDKSFIVVNTAIAELGWPYVWGAVGAVCDPDKRWYYAHRDVCPAGEKTQIYKTCQYYKDDGTKSGKSCGGCQFYPHNMRVLIDDCQGFCKQVFKRIGITLPGAGASTMYADKNAYTSKGKIADMPNVVCLVFMQNGEKMSHVGIHIGNGQIIHCSGTVKYGKTTDRGWTHYAVPKGMDGKVPTTDKPTLRKCSTGEYVTLLQTMLIQRGYSVGATGADGKYGNATYNAVKQYQRDNGLSPVDGICGRVTWASLDSGEVEKYTVTVQHVSRSVAESITSTYGGTMVKE